MSRSGLDRTPRPHTTVWLPRPWHEPAGNVYRQYRPPAQQSVLEQRFAKAFALVVLVNGEPGQDQHRRRMSGQSLHHPRRGRFGIDTAGCKAVEPNDYACCQADVGLCAVGRLIDECITLQELVQCRLCTIKFIDPIRSGELSDRAINGAHPSIPASVSSFFR